MTRTKQAEKKRAKRTELRRVKLKERKAEQRRGGQQGVSRSAEQLQMSDKLFGMIPESIREQCAAMSLARTKRCEHVPGLPAGFSLEHSAEMVWHVIPPADHPFRQYIRAPNHPAPEMAAVFAWDVSEGDFVALTVEISRRLIDTWIERGEVKADHAPILELVVASELLTGYRCLAKKFDHLDLSDLGAMEDIANSLGDS